MVSLLAKFKSSIIRAVSSEFDFNLANGCYGEYTLCVFNDKSVAVISSAIGRTVGVS